MRNEEGMKAITLKDRDNNITSVSNKKGPKYNKDDRLSMFTDDSSAITTEIEYIKTARERIYNYKKGSCSKLYEGKTKIIKLGKARRKNITQANINVNFTSMEETETEDYLGYLIGSIVPESKTFDKALTGIDILGEKWLKEHVGIYGRVIVANTLLQEKLSHRVSINRISATMRNKMKKKIKEFIWG